MTDDNELQRLVRIFLHYCPETGFFVWRARDEKWFSSRDSFLGWNSKNAGNRAGYIATTADGYKFRTLGIFGTNYLEHRLAWLWMTDDPLPAQIDHKNRDGTDNRWANLRASDPARNSRNRSKNKNNSSGVSGVSWDKKHKKWFAYGNFNKKMYALGRFKELDEAAMAAMEFRAENGFDPEHGMVIAPYHRSIST